MITLLIQQPQKDVRNMSNVRYGLLLPIHGVIPYQIEPPLEVTIFNFYKNWHTDWYILQDI